MRMVLEIKEKTFLSPSLQSYSSKPTVHSLNNRISSPTILLIIIIIAALFFISGLVHLLVRFLLRPRIRNSDEIENLTAIQGQLQQLFHLHDSGLDQSFIDALPIFNYKSIVGVKDPFDCAVCLSEFEVEDKLRLLPKCSHAFHMECIDTWLLSHSTCPICRASLIQEFNHNGSLFPVVRVLESGSQSSREVVLEGAVESHLSGECDLGQNLDDQVQEFGGFGVREIRDLDEKVVEVKLGKFQSVGGGNEGRSESSAEARRCFSMGSFAYVLDENSSLKVAITTSKKKSFKNGLGHRTAMSECGDDSRREFNSFEAFKILETQNVGGGGNKPISISKRDSFSVSKIWLSGRKDRTSGAIMELSRRAYSFRFPMHRNAVAAREVDAKNGGGGVLDLDEEIEMEMCKNLESEDDHPSFGRRSFQWIMGRQNKIVHSSFSSNV